MDDPDQGAELVAPAPPSDAERYASIKRAQKKSLSRRAENKPKAARPAVTYRAQRRNEAKAKKKAMYRIGADVVEGVAPSAELNRSQNFPRAATYGYAREISPVPERPVR